MRNFGWRVKAVRLRPYLDARGRTHPIGEVLLTSQLPRLSAEKTATMMGAVCDADGCPLWAVATLPPVPRRSRHVTGILAP